jgi:predicted amidohydrolase
VIQPVVKLAVVQDAISADVRENGRRARHLMREAARQGAHLLHFSEASLSGYTKSQITDKNWMAYDWVCLRQELECVAALAGELELWVVIGANHRLTPPHRPHNSLYVISGQGTLLNRYDKRFCSHTELTDWYTPGLEPVIFEVNGIRFGCALCIEIQFPEIFEEYRRLRADCILLSAYSDDPMYEVTARAHASLNNLWISFAVPANGASPLTSSLIGPNGDIQVKADHATGTIACGDIKPDDPQWTVPLRRARPWREEARRGIIYAERRVNDPRSQNKDSF